MEMPEAVEFMTPREFIEHVLNIREFDVYYWFLLIKSLRMLNLQ
jgi:hypothetical protein